MPRQDAAGRTRAVGVARAASATTLCRPGQVPGPGARPRPRGASRAELREQQAKEESRVLHELTAIEKEEQSLTAQGLTVQDFFWRNGKCIFLDRNVEEP